jgi:ribosomal protein S12 methylthiotransferase
LPGQVPDEVRAERQARFMHAQEKISRKRLKRKVGSVQQVLIDEVGSSVAIGRSSADAPEIDGKVYVHGAAGLKPGQFVQVRIGKTQAHDLHGELAG